MNDNIVLGIETYTTCVILKGSALKNLMARITYTRFLAYARNDIKRSHPSLCHSERSRSEVKNLLP